MLRGVGPGGTARARHAPDAAVVVLMVRVVVALLHLMAR